MYFLNPIQNCEFQIHNSNFIVFEPFTKQQSNILLLW